MLPSQKGNRKESLKTVAEVDKEIAETKRQLTDIIKNNDQMKKKISQNKLRTKDLEEIVILLLAKRIIIY